MKRKRKSTLSTTQVILLSFLLTVLVGSLLLSLPISTRARVRVPYIDALFTATTATCVTGLVTLPTATTWSVFGQAVILLLIQIGGLGVITVMAGVMSALHRKPGLRDSHLIGDAFNLHSLSDLNRFVRRVLTGTLVVECAGALLYLPIFVPEFGAKGIWIAFFNAVSAFCNAGIDIIGENSLCPYALHPLSNTVTACLVILGGLGYIVWWDLLRVLKQARKRGLRCLQSLTLHSKIVLSVTAFLILAGAVSVLALEYRNPLTLAPLSFFDKVQVALFQSVTTRTAGFAAIPQEHLTDACAVVSMLLMFIGGSPAGTAGGIKTVTAAVLAATAYATVHNRQEVSLFGRRLSQQAARKAVGVAGISFLIAFLSTVSLSAITKAPLLDVMYEAVSATATVGLSRSLTATLPTAAKWIVAATMYLGRVGPISLAIAFRTKQSQTNNIKNPTEEISVG